MWKLLVKNNYNNSFLQVFIFQTQKAAEIAKDFFGQSFSVQLIEDGSSP